MTQFTNNFSQVRPLVLAVSTVLVLAGCGSGGGGGGSTPTPAPAAGAAVDPYIIGAKVACSDDATNASTTGLGGNFTLPRACSAPATIVVTGGAGALHSADANGTDIIGTFEGTMSAPAGSTVVSPITTLLANGMTEAEVKTLFGITSVTQSLTTLDVNVPVSGADPNVLLRASMAVQSMIDDIVAAGGGSAASVIAATVKTLKASAPLDLTNPTAITNLVSSTIANVVAANPAASTALANVQTAITTATTSLSTAVPTTGAIDTTAVTQANTNFDTAAGIKGPLQFGVGVSANGGTPVALTDLNIAGAAPLNSVDFTLSVADTVTPLDATGQHAQVAMVLSQGSEKLAVAIDDLWIYDASGMQVSYPTGAHMYGYYTNGTQTATANLTNNVANMVTGSGNMFSVQLQTIAQKAFKDNATLVSSSPLLAGTATGSYNVTFAVAGIPVTKAQDGTGGLQGTKTVTIPNVNYTVTGAGATGAINF